MKKSEWNDKQIEELLQSMPKVSDRQSPDELYRKIQVRIQDDRIQHSNKKTWVLPSIATVAALFLIFIIGTNVMDIQNFSGGSTSNSEMSDMDGSKKNEEAGQEKATDSRIMEDTKAHDIGEESLAKNSIETILNKVVLQEDVNNKILITVAVTDNQTQQVIPISMLSSPTTKTKAELLKEFTSKIPAEELGVDNILKELNFKQINDDEVQIIVPNDMNLSSSAQNFRQIIIETLKWMGVKKAEVVHEDGRHVEDNYGPFTPFEIPQQSNTGYVIHQGQNGYVFLLPVEGGNDFTSTLEIIGDPAQNINNNIAPVGINLIDRVTPEGSAVTITFKEELGDSPENDLMVKAILLTAKEFGIEELKFINTVNKVGDYELKDNNGQPKFITVPAAPNYLEYLNQ